MKGWPDWTGETVVIGASGPSQCREDLEAVRGRARVLVINETWRLAPWADALYGCDASWWHKRAPSAKDFRGLRIVGKGDFPGVISAHVRAVSRMIWNGAAIGGGGHSGFQAINLAAACGARRIVLTGYDLSVEGGTHWHGDHGAGLNNPYPALMARCARLLDEFADELAARGVEVINASRETALTAYPRMSIEDALEGSGPILIPMTAEPEWPES